MKMPYAKIPERDVERRKFFGVMLNLPKRAWNRLTTEEMEDIALKRGLIKFEEETATERSIPESADEGDKK
jgi:hypothetical protein